MMKDVIRCKDTMLAGTLFSIVLVVNKLTFFHVKAAITFSALERDTSQNMNWPATTPFHGCNWKTPITEGPYFDRIPWTSIP